MKTIKNTMTFLAIALFFAFGTSAMASSFDDPNFSTPNFGTQSFDAQNLDQGLEAYGSGNFDVSPENKTLEPQLVFNIVDFFRALGNGGI